MALEAASRVTDLVDAKLRRGMLLARWAILIAYLLLCSSGVLPVTGVNLYVSTSVVVAYFLVITAADMAGFGDRPAVLIGTPYSDIVCTTMVVVATRDLTLPMWPVYFLTVVGAAHLVNRDGMLRLLAWAAVNFLAAAIAVDVLGHSVPWGYVLVIELLLAAMGLNATVLAGGQQKIRDVLAHAASTDSLTGVPNRRSFQTAFVTSLRDAIAHRLPLAFMLIDVDHFKEINDRDGHPAGDEKLRQVAVALTEQMRAGDLLARYGGDEFSVVAPGAARDDAVALADRLREAALGCGASISIGVALYPDDATAEEALVEAADRALYQAKASGRNCVRIAAA
jgi:diguanylate cyclase (GGDEF)-like protein